MGLIYRATNLVNGKIYIGQTVRTLHKRKLEHLNEAIKKESNFIFHKAIRKYENHNFKWEILGHCDNTNDLDFLEIAFIEKFKSNVRNFGYNMTDGGSGIGSKFGEDNPFYNHHHTEENKKLFSIFRIQNKISSMENNPAWKGGRFKHKKDGVIYIRNREHPSANKSGYVLEHILIMEEYLGRCLLDNEMVIHINKINDDNRLENLELVTRSEFSKRQGNNKGNIKDITGQKFGSLTAIRYSKTEKGATFWLCRCDCGKEVEKRQGNLISGLNYKCGISCTLIVEKKPRKKCEKQCYRDTDLIGKKFGTLTVLSFSKIENHVTFWLCKCDCGKIVEKRRGNLISGASYKCGQDCILKTTAIRITK